MQEDVCTSMTKMPYWKHKISPESGQKLWLVKKVILHSFIYCLWMRDKKHKVKKVKCKRNESTAKELILLEYNNILQKKKHLSFA